MQVHMESRFLCGRHAILSTVNGPPMATRTAPGLLLKWANSMKGLEMAAAKRAAIIMIATCSAVANPFAPL